MAHPRPSQPAHIFTPPGLILTLCYARLVPPALLFRQQLTWTVIAPPPSLHGDWRLLEGLLSQLERIVKPCNKPFNLPYRVAEKSQGVKVRFREQKRYQYIPP